jgi:hypothetical protein
VPLAQAAIKPRRVIKALLRAQLKDPQSIPCSGGAHSHNNFKTLRRRL